MNVLLATDVEAWSNVAANAAQVAAIVIGGWWAYTRFIKQREPFPKATVELVIAHRELDAEHTFVRVVVKVNNVGTALLETEELRAYVYQVLPIAPETATRLGADDLVPEDEREADWPCLKPYKGKWSAQIEPGEWDEFGFDFQIPTTVTTVFVYTYIKNVTQQRRELGWTVTKLYDLEDERGEARERNESALSWAKS